MNITIEDCTVEILAPKYEGMHVESSLDYGVIVTHIDTGISVTIPANLYISQSKKLKLALQMFQDFKYEVKNE